MNKKKQIKSTRGRGGGGRQKNAARKASPLQERDQQENKKDLCNYETSVKQPPKKAPSRRGRPRSRGVELPPVMYPFGGVVQPLLPQVAPVLPMPRRPPVNFRAQSMSIVLEPSTSQESDQSCRTADNNDDNKWPEDLEDLVREWDNLPQGHLWEVIKWLAVPESPTEPPVPLMVANIQEMMAEWEEAYENKVQQILEWLGYGDISLEQETPPKVVVEAVSSSVQDCGQWSSVAE